MSLEHQDKILDQKSISESQELEITKKIDHKSVSGSPVQQNLVMRASLDHQKQHKDTIQATLIAQPLPATHLSTTREVALPLDSAASPPRGCHATLAVVSLHTVR